MKITPLKMWVQNVLPVVYDDSLSYYEMVGKINEKTNEIIEQVNENTDDIEALNYVIQELGDIDELKALLEEVETIVNNLYTSDTPEMDSTNGSAGTANHAARSDHSHPSDTSKADSDLGISGASAGQFVKIKTVELGVPTEFENGMPHEVPSGGTTGQALRKTSNTNYAANWGDVHEIPTGGSTNNILIKNSGNNFDAGWTNTPAQMGSLAHINNGNAADRTYYKGDYLVYNGQLYVVSVPTISQGITLNPAQGGNISAIAVTDEVKLTSGTWTPVFPRCNVASIDSATWYKIGNKITAKAAITMGAQISGGALFLNPSSLPFNERFASPSNAVSGIYSIDHEGTEGCGIIVTSKVNNNAWFRASYNLSLDSSYAAGSDLVITLEYLII